MMRWTLSNSTKIHHSSAVFDGNKSLYTAFRLISAGCWCVIYKANTPQEITKRFKTLRECKIFAEQHYANTYPTITDFDRAMQLG